MSAPAPSRRGAARWRAAAAGPFVALLMVIAATIAVNDQGLPLRDPDHVAALYLGLVGLAVVAFVGLDVLWRAGARPGRPLPSKDELIRVRRERWTPRRALAAGAALAGFYLSYMAYRNVKSIVPLVRPDHLFDHELADWDRTIFFGNDPARVLHTLLGTGLTPHVLSTFYVAFIVFLPLTIGVSLVFSRDLRSGLFYTCAQSLNWVLGAASYFALPSMGPVYAFRGDFAGLPYTEVTRLQGVLLDQRIAFLRDPATATPQSIAAFASLHVSMSFTAALAAHLVGADRRLKIALWVWFVVTATGTIYLGWHYVLDDLAGMVLGTVALGIARLLMGIDLRAMRRAGARPERAELEPGHEHGHESAAPTAVSAD
jgi:membrane-associated phospholipid phosphatase